MRHNGQDKFTRILLAGKPHWINKDGSWIHPVVSGGDGDEDSDPNEGADGDKPTITQKQLNEILRKRTGAAKEKAVKDLLNELGVDDPEVLKQVLAKAKADDEANKSELAKAQESAQKAEAASKKLAQDLKNTQITNAVVLKLISQGLAPASARLASKLIEVEDLDESKIKEAVEGLKKEMPQLFETEKNPGVTGGNPGVPPPGGGGDGSDPQALAKKTLWERHPELNKK